MTGAHSREFLSSEIEVLLTKRLGPAEWEALVRPGRKIRVGERIRFGEGELVAEVVGRGEYGLRQIRLSADGDVNEAIERLGHVPLPPYISRDDETADRERYQTIFANHPGAVAAPTAGLHFSPAILEKLRQRDSEIAASHTGRRARHIPANPRRRNRPAQDSHRTLRDSGGSSVGDLPGAT